MLKNLLKFGLVAASLSVAAGDAKSAREIDTPTANITKLFNGSGVIEVTSSNGQTWTDIKDTRLVFPVKVDIGVPSGHVMGYKISSGGMSIKHELFAPFKPTQFSKTMSPSGMTGEMHKPFKDAIIAQCNEQLSGGQGIGETLSLSRQITVSLTAWTANASGESNDAMVRTADFSFPLKCIGKPKPGPYAGSNDVGFDHGEMKVRGIKLFLTTYSHAYSYPNPGTKCKKVKLLVRLNASRKGPVRFKLWKKVGDGAMTSKVIDLVAKHDGDGHFKAEHSEWISVSKTTYVQAKAEELVNPIGLSTPWEDITLYCTGAGGEGLTSNPNPHNPDDLPDVETLRGDFGFIDQGSPKCTRTGKALVSFRSPKADNIHFSLNCKLGSYSGVLPTVSHPDGGYMSAKLISFDIKETIDESCTLRTLAPYGQKDHVTKDHLFQCVKRTMDPVTNDFGVDKPSVDDSRPDKVVIDPPKVVPPSTGPNVIADPVRPVCRAGILRNSECFCASTHRKVAKGPMQWHCVRIVVDPPKTPPGAGPNVIIDPVRVVCLRGAVRNNSCFCPPKHRKTQTGLNRWQCDRVVIDPPKTPPGAGPNVIVDPVRVVCLKGAVRNNKCYCAPKHKKKVVGKNKWRCDPPSSGPKVIADPPRRVSCKNGAVRNAKCYCPRNRTKVRVGSNAWNCVPKATVVPPKKGGSAVNSGRPKIKTAPPVRTQPKKKKKKKKKSKKRRTSSNSGAVQMRRLRRR